MVVLWQLLSVLNPPIDEFCLGMDSCVWFETLEEVIIYDDVNRLLH